LTDRDIDSCEDALRVLAEHLDHELDQHLDRQLLEHLDSCRSCYSRSEFDRQLKKRVKELGHEPVPATVVDRVHELLREFALPPFV
jgi:anti-sigma factor (TIGR02949 family)